MQTRRNMGEQRFDNQLTTPSHSRKVYDYYNQLTTFKSKSFNQGSMSEGYIFCQSRQELTRSPNHIANTYAQQT